MNNFSVLTGIPEFTKGLVREVRVRWALEEMGLTHKEVRYPHAETKKEEYLKFQPFGQVPYFSDDQVCMFESGAILLHLALKYQKLLPTNEVKRADVLTWLFAALNSLEPFVFHFFMLKMDTDALESTKITAKTLIEQRLNVISKFLGEREFFCDSFSIADIAMTTVFKNAQRSNFLDNYKNLLEYMTRIEARPAYKRAMNEHFKLYEENV